MLKHLKYRNGALQLEGSNISALADKFGTPLYVYSSSALIKPLERFQQRLKKINPLICFAVKANSNIAILKLLIKNGAGVDLVSGGELFRALKAGVDPTKAVFSGVGKTTKEIEAALHAGIHSFNVESEPELKNINAIARRLNRPARIALRFNPNIDAKTHKYISTGLKKNKFGLLRNEILSIAKNAKKYPFIRIDGLSIHIGSQLLSLNPLEAAFRSVLSLAKTLCKVPYGLNLSFLDLGGGLGVDYKAGLKARANHIDDYCSLILKYFAESNFKIIIEPGRIISAESSVLVTRVTYIKKRGEKHFLIVDAGMNDFIRPALYDGYHNILPVIQRSTSTTKQPYDVVGPICESADCFGIKRRLPKSLSENALLVILGTGAYGSSMSNNYNSRCRPAEILVSGTDVKIIKRREKLTDLIRLEEY